MLPEIAPRMAALVATPFANPSSLHAAGEHAQDELQGARIALGSWLDADPHQVVFTASATEANALALHGHLAASAKNITLISSIEHPSVSENAGGEVYFAPVDGDGRLRLDEFAALLSTDIGVVSVMWANNETGAVQPIAEVAALCREHGVRLHVDAVQAAGKLPISLRALGADSYAVSAHKVGAPPGAAALIVCGHPPNGWMIGGGQQGGLRGGTEPFHSALLFSYAAEAWAEHGDSWRANMRAARDAFERGLQGAADVRVVAHAVERLPNTSSVLAPGVRGQAVLSALDLAGISISHGAACATGSLEPSPVLLAMGCSATEARSALRVSFGPTATPAEGDAVAQALLDAIKRLR